MTYSAFCAGRAASPVLPSDSGSARYFHQSCTFGHSKFSIRLCPRKWQQQRRSSRVMAQWNQSENNIQEAITIHVGIVNGDHTEAGGGLVCFAVYAIFALYYPSPENALFHLAGCDIDSGSFKPPVDQGQELGRIGNTRRKRFAARNAGGIHNIDTSCPHRYIP